MNGFLSPPSITARFKRIKELNWSLNLCLLQPKGYGSNYVILLFVQFLNDTDVLFPPVSVVSLYQHDISNGYFHMPLVIFHIMSFSKRMQVLFLTSVLGCVLTTFDILLPLLNFLVIIVKLFFWYCNWFSVY